MEEKKPEVKKDEDKPKKEDYLRALKKLLRRAGKIRIKPKEL